MCHTISTKLKKDLYLDTGKFLVGYKKVILYQDKMVPYYYDNFMYEISKDLNEMIKITVENPIVNQSLEFRISSMYYKLDQSFNDLLWETQVNEPINRDSQHFEIVQKTILSGIHIDPFFRGDAIGFLKFRQDIVNLGDFFSFSEAHTIDLPAVFEPKDICFFDGVCVGVDKFYFPYPAAIELIFRGEKTLIDFYTRLWNELSERILIQNKKEELNG